jgi:hypothetical protein
MTPETAQLGLAKFNDAVKAKPKQWAITDWPDLTKMPIFQSTIDLETYCENNNIDPYLETR